MWGQVGGHGDDEDEERDAAGALGDGAGAGGVWRLSCADQGRA